MNRTFKKKMRGYCEGYSRLVEYPVDYLLITQRKCRTQALKQLLSTPPASTEPVSRTCRLTYIVADFLLYLKVKPS